MLQHGVATQGAPGLSRHRFTGPYWRLHSGRLPKRHLSYQGQKGHNIDTSPITLQGRKLRKSRPLTLGQDLKGKAWPRRIPHLLASPRLGLSSTAQISSDQRQKGVALSPQLCLSQARQL